MSTAVKHKKPAVISLIVLCYTAEGIVLTSTRRTDIAFKIQIRELELFFAVNSPAAAYTNEAGQEEIINPWSL